ncbi:chemotaxis protein CheB [Pseudonocardia acaciae]|uniref:chemotaxis protein CheB n=1 Tax=Pseudonocardia acaciae TaxID=551276 RepID=UPI000A3EC365|nr:chemotaxis protein CheB [Pseudonocardia acaciae]
MSGASARRRPGGVSAPSSESSPAEFASGDADRFDVVAVCSSAGGIRALTSVLGDLPADFPVPVLVVQHLDPRHETVIAEVLARRTRLRVKLAEQDERVEPGVVHIAPPNRHLLVGHAGVLTLSSSELVHFVRPSADLLFESVAGAYGAAAIACVLTGSGSDGAMGVSAIKSRGGTVVVEDPETAEFGGMPGAAAATGTPDFVLPLAEVAPVIRSLVQAGRS